jgi:excisionase family DNA binding protein
MRMGTKLIEAVAAAAAAVENKVNLVGEGFVGVPEAARFLGLSRAKLYQLMDVGDLAYAKFGKSRRIPRKALVEFAARCLVGA